MALNWPVSFFLFINNDHPGKVCANIILLYLSPLVFTFAYLEVEKVLFLGQIFEAEILMD